MIRNPDDRRGWRTVIVTIIIFVLLWIIWTITDRLTDAPSLRQIAQMGFAVIGLFMIGYVMENGLRSIKWNLPGGFGGEANAGDTPDTPGEAADAVVNAGKAKAAEIKGAEQ